MGITVSELGVSVDSATVSVVVTDPDGNFAQSSVNIVPVQTAAPTVELIQPMMQMESTLPMSLLILLRNFEDERDEIEDLEIVWESSLDGVLDVGLMVDSSTQILPEQC